MEQEGVFRVLFAPLRPGLFLFFLELLRIRLLERLLGRFSKSWRVHSEVLLPLFHRRERRDDPWPIIF